MQEAGSVSLRRLELNQLDEGVMKREVNIRSMVVSLRKALWSFLGSLTPSLNLIHFISHKQSWAYTLCEVAQDCTDLTSFHLNNSSRVSRALSRRPAPPDLCQATSRVFVELSANTSPFTVRTATILQHPRQRPSSVFAVVSV